jgi:hypothetical protein
VTPTRSKASGCSAGSDPEAWRRLSGGRTRSRQAALKLIRSDLADDQDFWRRFAREVAAASMVRSPVAAAVLAADPTADRP